MLPPPPSQLAPSLPWTPVYLLASPPADILASKAYLELVEKEVAIEGTCGMLTVSNLRMKRLFRRAKRALAFETEAVALEKDDCTLVVKAIYCLGDNEGLGNDAAARDCTEVRSAHPASIVTSCQDVEFLKHACSRANGAMNACEVAGGNLSAAIEIDDRGMSMDDRIAAEDARADL